MRSNILVIAALLLFGDVVRAVPPPGFEPIEGGHVDFSFCYRDGAWSYGIVWERDGVPVIVNPAVGPLRPPENAIILLKDQAFPSEGNRVARPAAAEWGLTGVDPGQPFWLIPQNPTGPGVWQGFTICGNCASYFSNDPRVNAFGAWTIVNLKGKRYIGKGKGHYCTWSEGAFGEVTAWMTTHDEIQPGVDRYFIGADHAHPAAGFSDLGLYEITYDVTCHEGPGEANPQTSPEVSFYFAVGTYWAWIARNWQPERWWQSGQIGEHDDPDADGLTNLIEYACGLNPRVSDSAAYTEGASGGLPSMSLTPDGLRFQCLQRSDASNPQITSIIRATNDLTATPWPPAPAVTMDEAITEGWDRATIYLPLGPQTPRQFYKVEINLLPEIKYPNP